MNVIPISKIDNADKDVQIYKALTHPARIKILRILQDGERCVCHMEAHLGYRQSYISQQLSVLRDADLIQDRREGWNIFYRVTKPEIYKVLDMIEQISGVVSKLMKAEPVSCPCPHCAIEIG